MFDTFPSLRSKMAVFNPWNMQRSDLARRVNSIQRKLLGAMLLIEQAEEYPRSVTMNVLDGVREMRVMDTYTDASMAQLHGALDMLASALSTRHGLANRHGRPYSFGQMFASSGRLDKKIASSVSVNVTTKLEDLMASAKDLIDENNGAKHATMEDVFLFPGDYPDFLKDLSAALQPEVSTGRNVRDWLSDLRARTDDIGHKICNVVDTL